MRFLALSPYAAYALLGAVALIIALLHLLKPPPPKVVVSSLLVWARVARSYRRANVRRLLSLLLALAAGLSLALAFTRPEVPSIGAVSQRLILILDDSPSMAARMHDGRTRWQRALDEARALLRQAGASEVMLLDTNGRIPGSGFLDRNAALERLKRAPSPGWGNAWIPPTPASGSIQVHLFTDGVAQVAVPDGAIVHRVFEPADNVAVTAFEVRAQTQDPTRYEALVQVLNASPGDQRVRLLIKGGDGFSIARDLELRAGEIVNAAFDVSDFEGGVLGAAAVAPSDAFPFDDLAYAVVPPHRPKRVLLVTPGNPPLEDALRNLPGVRVTVVRPDAYAHAAGRDALVFDRFAPVEPPSAGALLLAPPSRKWLGGGSGVELTDARVTDWNDGHAVTGGIAWRNVRLTRAAVDRTEGAPGQSLVSAMGSSSGTLVAARESRVRWVKVGFALEDSNFALQADFPVFLGNALTWVTEPMPVLARPLGSIEVALRHGRVRDGSGNPVAASPTAQGVVFDAQQADVYTVTGPNGQALVVANLPDPSFALINNTHLTADGATATRAAHLWNAELWMLLLLLAVAFLLVEWTVYTKRLAG